MCKALLLLHLAFADIPPPPKDTSEPRDPSASGLEEKEPTRSVAPPPERGCMASVAVGGLILAGFGLARRREQQLQPA